MEFLQQGWINNGNFMSLGEERDPNIGPQEAGFNVLRGGEYFFMPSLSALKWLGHLHQPGGAHFE
jgi:hypothetical protein